MATYRIYLETTASSTVEVEADSEEEALNQLWEGYVELPYSCHQCPEIGDWELPSDIHPNLKQSELVTKISD